MQQTIEFDEYLDTLRERLFDYEALHDDGSLPDFGELMSDYADVTPKAWESQAYDELTDAFGAGANGPLIVAADLGSVPVTGPEDPRLLRLYDGLAGQAAALKLAVSRSPPRGAALPQATCCATPCSRPTGCCSPPRPRSRGGSCWCWR